MAQSGFIMRVPEAEPLVGDLRARFDASARLGVPAHITVLFPFMPPADIDASRLQRIENAVGSIRAFSFSLAKVARFPTTTYLVPEPPTPFVLLTESLVREFPTFPPYGGEFPAIIPHLTVAHGGEAEASIAENELIARLAVHGSVASTCNSIALIENSSGSWRAMHEFTLAHAPAAA